MLLDYKRSEVRAAWILFFAGIIRGALHYWALKMSLTEVIFDMYYLLVLYFSLLAGFEFISTKFFGGSTVERQKYYFDYAWCWLLIFPAVPIITLLTKTGYMYDIPVFKYIPTMLVKDNFLPTGMIYVIPLIFYFSLIHLAKHIQQSLLIKVFLIASVSTITYLLYYQWLVRLFMYVRQAYSQELAIGVYGSILISILFLIQWILFKQKVLHVAWVRVSGVMLYTYVFLVLVRVWRYFFSF